MPKSQSELETNQFSVLSLGYPVSILLVDPRRGLKSRSLTSDKALMKLNRIESSVFKTCYWICILLGVIFNQLFEDPCVQRLFLCLPPFLAEIKR